MDTQTIVTLAVAINVAVALAAIVLPRIAHRRARTATRRFAASLPPLSTAGSGDSDDPASPWFPERAGRSASNGHESQGPWVLAAGGPPIDPETGLDVEASWSRWLTEEEARIRRFHRPATVVLVDLAGFDRLSARLGREAADRLIPPVATTMRRYSRETDHLARLGPTRFAALLPETDEIEAINFVERIRSACDVWLAAGAVALRLAIGWAEIGADRSAAVAVPDAEQRLFADRQRSRLEDREPSGSGDAASTLASASSG
ncbi:MAG: GGDEF domain-containing protein [Chloroflexi bacterium]|nr:MAG: GGDEF domain-containing protein [Chloroflexota bacterium]